MRRKTPCRLILSISLSTLRARVATQRDVFKAARGRDREARIRRVDLAGARDREKETLARETCVRVPLFRVSTPVPFYPSLPLPWLSPFLICSFASRSLSVVPRSATVLSTSRSNIFLLSDAVNRAQTSLTVAVATAAAQHQRCMSLRLCATSMLRSSLHISLSRSLSLFLLFSLSFSLSLNAHRKSRATLHFTTHAVAAVRTLRHQHLHFARAVRARRRDLSSSRGLRSCPSAPS